MPKELDAKFLSSRPIKEKKNGEIVMKARDLEEAERNIDAFIDAVGNALKEADIQQNSILQAWELKCSKCGDLFFFGRTGWELDRFSSPRQKECPFCTSEEEHKRLEKYAHLGRFLTHEKALKYQEKCKYCDTIFIIKAYVESQHYGFCSKKCWDEWAVEYRKNKGL